MTEGLSTAEWADSIALLIDAVACLIAWRAARAAGDRRVWIGLAIVLAALTLYRLGNVEHWLNETLRADATRLGVYHDRRLPQAILSAVVVVALVGLAGLFVRWRGHPYARIATLAVAMLAGLIVLRILSLHMIDALLYGSILGVRVNWAIELVLLGTVAAAALAFARSPAKVARRGYPGRR